MDHHCPWFVQVDFTFESVVICRKFQFIDYIKAGGLLGKGIVQTQFLYPRGLPALMLSLAVQCLTILLQCSEVYLAS